MFCSRSVWTVFRSIRNAMKVREREKDVYRYKTALSTVRALNGILKWPLKSYRGDSLSFILLLLTGHRLSVTYLRKSTKSISLFVHVKQILQRVDSRTLYVYILGACWQKPFKGRSLHHASRELSYSDAGIY